MPVPTATSHHITEQNNTTQKNTIQQNTTQHSTTQHRQVWRVHFEDRRKILKIISLQWIVKQPTPEPSLNCWNSQHTTKA